jgi:NitT/TauT family transport system permease protein/taurine transport system permease protein
MFILPRIDPSFRILFPPPSTAFAIAGEMLASGELIYHVAHSLKRVLIAWSLMAGIAIPLGIAMGWWRWFYDRIEPMLELVRPIPPIAWIPLSILWFGIGDLQNEFIISIGAFFPILLNTIHGVNEVENIYIRAARTLGANQWNIFKKIILWGSLPSIFTGLRLALGVSWMCLVAGELVGATSGLGFLMMDARNFLRTDIVVMTMLLIGLIGIIMDRILISIRKFIMPWHVTA